VTPAMVTGLTDDVWTMDALLSCRVPPHAWWSRPGSAFTRYRDTTISYKLLAIERTQLIRFPLAPPK